MAASRFGGFMGKILDVDLSTGRVGEYEISDDDREKFLGGKALAAKVLFDELPAGVDSLAPENPLVFMTGALTGTGAPCTSRFNVSTKNVLTGGIASSNCGGRFGLHLKWAGWDGLIVRGRSARPVFLEILEDRVSVKDARHLWGLDTVETQAAFDEKLGKLAIGPAGENLVRFASIASGHRLLGRCGVGAVMGSKRLKAVVATGSMRPRIHDPEGFAKVVAEWTKILKAHPITGGQLPGYGTDANTIACNVTRTLPTRNFQKGTFEAAFEVSGEAMTERILATNSNCKSCPIRCGRVVEIGGKRMKGPEYETVGLLGPNLGIADLEKITEWSHLSDRMGMDTISLGGTLACAMELAEKGRLKTDLAFGRAENLAKTIEDIAYRRGLGDELAEGSLRLARRHGAEEVAMQSKGLEMAAYEPRHAVGHGLGYATSNRGACHVNGGYMVFFEALGAVTMDPFTPQAKPAYTVFQQNMMEAVAAAGNCIFTTYAVVPPPPADVLPAHSTAAKTLSRVMIGAGKLLEGQGRMPPWMLPFHLPLIPHTKAIAAATGMKMDLGRFSAVGERGFTLERLFNLREGLGSKDDALPPRMTDEPEDPRHPESKVPLAEMLPVYFRVRDWDEAGMPTPRLLGKLGLDWHIPDLLQVRRTHAERVEGRAKLQMSEGARVRLALTAARKLARECKAGRSERAAAFARSEREARAAAVRDARFEVVTERCRACGLCVKPCPTGAVKISGTVWIDPTFCIACGACEAACPPHFAAVRMTPDARRVEERSRLRYEVARERCEKCGICAKTCPAHAIAWEKKQAAAVDQALCVKCGHCITQCPPKWAAIEAAPERAWASSLAEPAEG